MTYSFIGHFSIYGGNMLNRTSNETGVKETFEMKYLKDLKLQNEIHSFSKD